MVPRHRETTDPPLSSPTSRSSRSASSSTPSVITPRPTLGNLPRRQIQRFQRTRSPAPCSMTTSDARPGVPRRFALANEISPGPATTPTDGWRDFYLTPDRMSLRAPLERSRDKTEPTQPGHKRRPPAHRGNAPEAGCSKMGVL